MVKDEKQFYRVKECHETTGLTTAWLRRAILERRVDIVKVGRVILIPKSEIERLVSEGFQPRIGK